MPTRLFDAIRPLAASVFMISRISTRENSEALEQIGERRHPAARRQRARQDFRAEDRGDLVVAERALRQAGSADHSGRPFAISKAARWNPTNSRRSSPVAIFAHQLDSVPLKVM